MDVYVIPGPWAPACVGEMDRMKIIKRRLSMSLRSARPVDDSLSELAEQMTLDEPTASRDNGEKQTELFYRGELWWSHGPVCQASHTQ